MAIEPARDRGQGRVPEVRFEQPPNPWDVGEVLALAIALPQAREDAQDLAIALGRENGGRADESPSVEARESGEVALGHRSAQGGRNIAPGILAGRSGSSIRLSTW